MQTTSKIFVSCLFCLALSLLSGCGGSVSFTPAEQAEVDKLIAADGRDALKVYLGGDDRCYSVDDEKRALKYCKYLVSQGSDVEKVSLFFPALVGHVEVLKFLVSRAYQFLYRTHVWRFCIIFHWIYVFFQGRFL